MRMTIEMSWCLGGRKESVYESAKENFGMDQTI